MAGTVINGILLIYNQPVRRNASTIPEHVNSFQAHSRFKVWNVNTYLGFPKNLNKLRFKTVVLHYSLFGWKEYPLDNNYLAYLEHCQDSHKIAFFQDEYSWCRKRFDFINKYGINCIYSLLEPEYFKDVYQKYTKVKKIYTCIPGYVSDELLQHSRRYFINYEDRTVDVGYRGRELPFYMGEAAQEKTEIARIFAGLAQKEKLKLDLGTKEGARLYGSKWYSFLANCKAVLGVEAGVSVFDLEDEVLHEYEKLMATRLLQKYSEFKEKARAVLDRWENRIFYRTISPRHFEAAAFKNCQLLFAGKYSGIMNPMKHYLPLKKDFSNIKEILSLLKNEEFCRQLTDNAYRDLIASGKYSYRQFMEGFDNALLAAGLTPEISPAEAHNITRLLAGDKVWRMVEGYLKFVKNTPFPGRKIIADVAKKLIVKTAN